MDELRLQEIHLDFVASYMMFKGQIIGIISYYPFNKDNVY